jgi:hypothetical protein
LLGRIDSCAISGTTGAEPERRFASNIAYARLPEQLLQQVQSQQQVQAPQTASRASPARARP